MNNLHILTQPRQTGIKPMLALVFCGALFACVEARGDTITLNGFANTASPVTADYNATIIRPGLSPLAAQAGLFDVSLNGISANAFCVDVYKDVVVGETISDYTAVSAESLFGAVKANDLGLLATQYGTATSLSSSLNGAAFQLAVWEILNEQPGDPYDLTSGLFQANTGYPSYAPISLANSWLSNLGTDNAIGMNFIVEQSPTHQDLFVFQGAAIVPEPGTGVLLASLGGMLLLNRRRRAAGAGDLATSGGV